MIYANDHNGQFPDSLGVLIREGLHLTPKILFHPQSEANAPPNT